MDKALIRVYECDPVTVDEEFLLSKAKVSGDIRPGAEARRLRRRLPRGHQNITGGLYQPVVAAVVLLQQRGNRHAMKYGKHPYRPPRLIS